MMYFRQFYAVAQVLVSMVVVVVVERGLFFIYRMATMSTISRSCPEIPPSNVSIKSSRSEDPKKTLNNAKKHFIMVQLSSIQDWRCGVASTTLRANCNTAAKSRGVATAAQQHDILTEFMTCNAFISLCFYLPYRIMPPTEPYLTLN